MAVEVTRAERFAIRVLSALAVAGWLAGVALRLRHAPLEQDDETFEHLGVA